MIKPCPFCGADAVNLSAKKRNGYFFEIGCPNFQKNLCDNDIAAWGFGREAAVARWNSFVEEEIRSRGTGEAKTNA